MRLAYLSTYSNRATGQYAQVSENEVHSNAIEIASIPDYANALGPSRRLIVHDDGTVTALVERAHELGLEVHAWTLLGDQDAPPV